MDHIAHIGLVDSHSKGDGGTYDLRRKPSRVMEAAPAPQPAVMEGDRAVQSPAVTLQDEYKAAKALLPLEELFQSKGTLWM